MLKSLCYNQIVQCWHIAVTQNLCSKSLKCMTIPRRNELWQKKPPSRTQLLTNKKIPKVKENRDTCMKCHARSLKAARCLVLNAILRHPWQGTEASPANLSTWEAEAGGLKLIWLHSESEARPCLLKNNKNTEQSHMQICPNKRVYFLTQNTPCALSCM